MNGPNPFCETVPTLLRAWDATALRLYMECPRKYELAIVQGYRGGGGNPDTEFGSLYHAGLDLFDKARAKGLSKADALDLALEYVLGETAKDGVYWSGEYKEQWRCTGKIGRKKCPYSKKWHDGPSPQETCGTCSSLLQTSVNWLPKPGYKWKNRKTLVRSLVEYVDNEPEEGGLRPFVFPDGTVASELSFRIDLPFTCPDGTPYLLTGNMDGMVQSESLGVATRERKTTKNSLDDRYWGRFAPNVQVDTYDLASDIMYGDTLKPAGVILEATQVAIGFTRVERRFIHVPSERREEWFREIEYWIKRAEADARAGYFPKNTASCGNAGGCPYARICRLAPSARERFIPEYFTLNPWNPLQER